MRALALLLAVSLASGATVARADAVSAERAGLSAMAAAPGGSGSVEQAVALSGTVTLKSRPTAHDSNVYLQDLIEQRLPPEVGAIAVKPSGGPGSVVVVDPALVDLKLRRAPGGPYALKAGYRELQVAVPAQKVSGKILLHFAENYLHTQLSGTTGVDIQPQGKVFGLTLYDSQLRFRVRPPDDHALRGYVELRVDVLQSSFNDEDKVVAEVPVSFLIHRQETRLVTTQAVNRGDFLGPQNLAPQVMDTTFAADGFSDLASAQGRIAKTYIPAGRPLDVDMVDLPLSIRQGDAVRLLVRSGGVEIQASARALRDARVGDTLPLQIPDTGKLVQARCVDADVAVQNAW